VLKGTLGDSYHETRGVQTLVRPALSVQEEPLPGANEDDMRYISGVYSKAAQMASLETVRSPTQRDFSSSSSSSSSSYSSSSYSYSSYSSSYSSSSSSSTPVMSGGYEIGSRVGATKSMRMGKGISMCM
jgi:hypothetical protein